MPTNVVFKQVVSAESVMYGLEGDGTIWVFWEGYTAWEKHLQVPGNSPCAHIWLHLRQTHQGLTKVPEYVLCAGTADGRLWRTLYTANALVWEALQPLPQRITDREAEQCTQG